VPIKHGGSGFVKGKVERKVASGEEEVRAKNNQVSLATVQRRNDPEEVASGRS
jgi:hypothetical protein